MIALTVSFSRKKVLLQSVAVVAVFVAGLLLGESNQNKLYRKFLANTLPIRENAVGREYVNPLLGITSPAATQINMFLPLKDSLETLIEDAELSGDIDAAAIYFRDLNSTFWFGINEDDSYVTASLFKLPVAIAAYRQGEDDPFFFQRKAYYTQEIAKENNPAQGAAPSVLVVGKGYYIKDLVRLMIVDSDNGAKDLLIASIDKKHTEDVFDFSALIEPDVKRQYSLSPKNYSIFFRILYSGTYLSKENSNDLLKLLTESSFKDGIVSGVDSSVKVAHKFGLYVINRPTAGSPGEEELHDCGIIYHPRHPYLLCIMTKGKSDVSLKRFISKASQIVYKNVGADYDQ